MDKFLILFSSTFTVVIIIFLTLPAESSSQVISSDEERLMGDPNDKTEWRIYKKKFTKLYSNEEDKNRHSNFVHEMKMIQLNNDKSNATFQMAHNFFTDFSPDEKKSLLGTSVKNVSHKSKPINIARSPDLEPLVDLRYCLTEVKNQGKYPASSVFSAIATLEYAYCKKYNKIVILSEQQIVSCQSESFPYCAWYYLKNTRGSVSNLTLPYTSGKSGKKGDCLSYQNRLKIAQISSYFKILGDIESAVKEHGVLSVAMTVVDSFYSYWNGVYSDSSCTSITKPVNHAVAIVGYDVSKNDTYKSTEDMNYWIVRNSWGPKWGKKGHAFIQRGANMCKIETYVYAVKVK